MKTMFLANNVYGKHGGPYDAGSALGLLFHLLSGGDGEIQGFYGHVIGGMGSITQALASACRKSGGGNSYVGTGCESGCARRPRARRRPGRRHGDFRALRAVERGSQAHFSRSGGRARASRRFSPRGGRNQDGRPLRQSKFRVKRRTARHRHAAGMAASQRALFTLVPSLEFAERCYDIAKFGEIPEELWVDCVVASNVDSTLAPPGKHVMTTFIQYVPYKLRQGTWDEKRELLGDRVVKKIAEYAPNVPHSIIARQVLTPLDLERTYGLTEGNIFHGDLSLEQLFFMRPVAGLGAVPHARRRTLSLRRGRASGRRGHRRAGIQRGASSACATEGAASENGARVMKHWFGTTLDFHRSRAIAPLRRSNNGKRQQKRHLSK